MKKKLTLKKVVISNLEKSAMSRIKGGGISVPMASCIEPTNCLATQVLDVCSAFCPTQPTQDGGNTCGGENTCGGANTCVPNNCATDPTNGGYDCFMHSIATGITHCNC